MAYADIININILSTNEAFNGYPKRFIEKCMAKADALIDGELGALYGLPFATPYPVLIVSIAEDLTLHYMYKFGMIDGTAGVDENTIKSLYNDSMDLLTKIKIGDVILPDVTLSASAGNGARYNGITSSTENYGLALDLDTDLNWEVDPDLISEIEDDR